MVALIHPAGSLNRNVPSLDGKYSWVKRDSKTRGVLAHAMMRRGKTHNQYPSLYWNTIALQFADTLELLCFQREHQRDTVGIPQLIRRIELGK